MNPAADESGPARSSTPNPSTRLILFTRYPLAGRVKTRLIPVLGSEGAARLHRRLTLRAIRAAENLAADLGSALEIHCDGATEAQVHHWLGDRFTIRAQADGDLGRRLAVAFEQSFEQGAHATVILGSDCPGLDERVLSEAFARLREHPIVLGPARDGGYYLVGLRRPLPELFRGITWGSSSVLAESLAVLQRLELKPALLQPLDDIDRPEDLPLWRDLLQVEEGDAGSISVIIPALNEAQQIAPAIASARAGGPLEVIVVDGGSCDETVRCSLEAGATTLASSPGRARQMNAGAVKARGHILLFLHADTLLPKDYCSAATDAFRHPEVAAAAFRFALAESFLGGKLVEWSANLRSRWFQMPYGDQGLMIRRALFEELGGFPDLPILEDYEMVRRVRKVGRVRTLAQPAVTSGRRWRRLGFVRTTLINKRVILGYRLGHPIERLAAIYRQA